MMELTGADGTVGAHVIGGSAGGEYSPQMIRLTLAERTTILAGLQCHPVQAQTEDHCQRRRHRQRCGARRPIRDVRSRRLMLLFGTAEVRVPCRCAVTSCRILSPIAEIMPDR
jgi:hypothetical protein